MGLSPAVWTFGIWGIIYTLISIFVVYQAFPSDMFPSRNDDLIFNQIGWLFSINMCLQVIWLPSFMSDTAIGFIVSEIVIAAMLGTALMMAMAAVEATNNSELKYDPVSLISIRGGMSIYAGWLTAATILGASNMLKHMGMSEENGWNEETWTLIMLWIALMVYAGTTYIIDDPIYGAVLIWASMGIRDENVLDSTAIETSLNAFIGIMSVLIPYVALT